MKLSELIKECNIISNSVKGDPDIAGIEFDSRKVYPGCVFVALKGIGADGHDYVALAEEKGAVACIVEHPCGKRDLVVDNCRKALAIIASAFFNNPAKDLKLIGVTGTNGKTTSTYLIKQMLEDQGYKVGLIGTIQNMIGDVVLETGYTTPEPVQLHETFAEMKKAGVEYVVMEVSSQALDQYRVYGLSFLTCAFTNLTQDHLDYHKTMENYLLAKSKLFSMTKYSALNADEKASIEIQRLTNCRGLTYSANGNTADVTASNIRYGNSFVEFDVHTQNETLPARINIPGRFSVYNALTVITVGLTLNFSLKKMLSSLSRVSGVKGRVEVVPTDTDYTVLIDYAHTPDALENVLKTLKEVAVGRIITVFGCGGDRDRTKRPIMGKIATALSDFTVITSDNPRTENPKAILDDIVKGVEVDSKRFSVVENRKEAILFALSVAQKNDIVLLAGKGHETYQILNTGKIHFDEREVVAEALAK